MRYFMELAYRGTNYCGWQAQPNGTSVQGTLEHALSLLLGTPTAVVGCGRTDTGVHASQYFLHFDTAQALPDGFCKRLNMFLGDDIAIRRIFEVHSEAHARYDAVRRGYQYVIATEKEVFRNPTVWYFHGAAKLNRASMHETAQLIAQQIDFEPFCKTNNDLKNKRCTMYQSVWTEEGTDLVYRVSANRFVRGMVRLIVGCCIDVGLGRLSLDDVAKAFAQQSRLSRSLSVPAHGLTLCEVEYDEPAIRV
jgi:tRNA pseudouridine38-40 synthase